MSISLIWCSLRMTLLLSACLFTLAAVSSASTFTVNNTLASAGSSGSLPWAIDQANRLSGGGGRILFNIPGAGPHRITLQDRLWVNERMTIDATSQPGYSGEPLIWIDVNGLPNAFTLLGPTRHHSGSSGSVISGLRITNFRANAIATQSGSDGNTISRNHLGFYRDHGTGRWWRNFEATLTPAEMESETPIYNGYTEAVGVGIQSSDNVISDNVISGVSNGISIGYASQDGSGSWGPANDNNHILRNFIGTTPDGAAILTNTPGAESYDPRTIPHYFGAPRWWRYFGNNSDGIYLTALATGTVIANNVTSGNFSVGIELLHETVTGSLIYGNMSGVDVSGEHRLPNGELGIILSNGAKYNTVGLPGSPNIFSGNFFGGVCLGGEGSFERASHNVVQGNHIGCNRDCTRNIEGGKIGVYIGTPHAHHNTIVGNFISGNRWGVYLENAHSNVISNNWIGLSSGCGNLGNEGPGITLDRSEGNIVSQNHVAHNGYGVTGHDDWFYAIWEQGNEANWAFDNLLTNNRTGTNMNNLRLYGADAAACSASAAVATDMARR